MSAMTPWRGLLAILITLAPMGCVAPDSAAATSCGGNLTFSDAVDPNLFRISAFFVDLRPGAVSPSIAVCFYRDRQRDTDAERITWEIADVSIATVEPTLGPRTRVTARSAGRTRLVASLGALTDSVEVTVCQPTGPCP